jgi:hypothetical protein
MSKSIDFKLKLKKNDNGLDIIKYQLISSALPYGHMILYVMPVLYCLF